MPRLAHVNIRTADLEPSVAFYRDVLGLRPGRAETRPQSSDHVWMSDEDGNPCVHLQRTNASAVSANDVQGFHHVALSCEDVDHWRERLRSLGVQFRQTEFGNAGIVQLNLKDPNGVRLELLFEANR